MLKCNHCPSCGSKLTDGTQVFLIEQIYLLEKVIFASGAVYLMSVVQILDDYNNVMAQTVGILSAYTMAMTGVKYLKLHEDQKPVKRKIGFHD